jgi:PKD repeat protein
VKNTPTRQGRTAGVLLLTSLLTFTPVVASAAGSTDRTPPAVTATAPTNGTVGAAVTVQPTATFSEPIQPSSVAATFAAGGTAVPFTTAYASTTRTVTITPSGPLTWSTKYTLSIKAKDLAGNQMTGAAPTWSFTTTAAPDDPPAAKLIASPTSGTSPLSVHLDASGSTDTDATPIAGYNFDWGDGTGTSGQTSDPTADHVYTQVGTWTAVVTVRDTAGKTSTGSVPITVQAAPPPDSAPVASLLVSPSSGEAPLNVTLDASGTTDTDATPVDTYAFDFGDGSSAPSGASPSAAHTYTAAGTYTATVTATDTAGNSSQASTSVVVTKAAVPDNPPSAALRVAPAPTSGPYAVTADATQSTDDDDTPIASYTFDYGDGSDPATGTAPTGQHTYAGAGTYTVTVTVTDTTGHSSRATATVTLEDPPPPPTDDPPVARLKLSPTSGTAPVNVTADASASTDTDATGIESYAFDWGDGLTVAAQGASTVQHTYPAAGTYTVQVTVTDTAGRSSSASATVSVAAAPSPPPASTKPTSVVLTFDDGTVGQDDAAGVMAGYGLRGTFYINSARVGMQDYLSAAQLTSIAADGNEIAGHTLDHADLTTLTSDDAARQVCDDRVALHDMGFKVTSFAYPFGAYNSSVQTAVKNCGYNSARIVASLRSNPYGCASCVTGNAVPLADPYAIKTNTSVRADTTLAMLQTYVTQAENDKGGLVPIVFHHIGSTGDANEMSLAVFTEFVDWLSHRPSTTQVVTMDQVVGGAARPYVAGPALPTALNVLNPSLEAGSGVTPTCFNPTGYGANSPTWSRDASSAHTGSFGEGLSISSWTTGDRKLVIKQDVSGNACAPAGAPGHQYQPTVWYKGSWTGSTHVNIVTYYRDVNGAWHVWATGGNLAASSTMQPASLTTSPLPAGATAVSFGLALVGTGQLSTDDYGMADVS